MLYLMNAEEEENFRYGQGMGQKKKTGARREGNRTELSSLYGYHVRGL